jgi:cellulose synthase/poly-beta-1,6-N-acetylglucosamine synthase-like glycosyltransferase
MATTPSVTVIVPARNEEAWIEQCIASIQSTGWPSEQLEIIVVDNCSTDATTRNAARSGARVIHQDTGAIGAVRNAGLKAARGDFVAYVDGDCTVARSWISSAVALLEADQRVGAVGGPCLSPNNGTWVERSLASCCLTQQDVTHAEVLATSSFIARKSLLLDVGLFDETLFSGEDDNISQRIKCRGLVLVSAPDCHVIHYGYPRTWWEVVKKQTWHGSNQLEACSGLDATLLLTHVFLISCISSTALLAIASIHPTRTAFGALFASLAAACLAPLFFALKNLRVHRWSPSGFLRRWAVGFAYFSGRSLGLLANYWRRLRGGSAGHLRVT